MVEAAAVRQPPGYRAQVIADHLVQSRREADPTHAERGQFVDTQSAPAEADIHRSGERGDHLGDPITIAEGYRIDTVGSGGEIEVTSADRLFHSFSLVANGLDEGIDPCVDHDVHTGGVGRGADGGDESGLFLGVYQYAVCVVVGVFEVAANGAGAEQTVDEVRRIEPVPGFEVGRHGAGHGSCNPTDEVEDDVRIARVVVVGPEHTCDGTARRRDEGETGLFHYPGRGSVPDVRKNERLGTVMGGKQRIGARGRFLPFGRRYDGAGATGARAT